MSILGEAMVKVAISSGRLKIPQARKGRRPMSVDTLLRKEKEGTLYKEAEGHKGVVQAGEDIGKNVENVRGRLSNLLGLDVGGLGRQRLIGTVFGKVKNEIEGIGKEGSLPEAIFQEHLRAHPEHYKEAEVGAVESKLPWYTTAGLGAAGGLAGNALLPKKLKALGTVGGTLLGTGIGLEGGTALGRKIDQMRKRAGSQQPMQRMFGEGAARGIDNYIMQDFGLGGKPATAKVRPGDVPSRDEAPSYLNPSHETMPGTNRSMDLAMKAAGAVMARLVDQGEEFPTSDQGERVDPSDVHRREHRAFQNAGADTPTTEWNPDWRKR